MAARYPSLPGATPGDGGPHQPAGVSPVADEREPRGAFVAVAEDLQLVDEERVREVVDHVGVLDRDIPDDLGPCQSVVDVAHGGEGIRRHVPCRLGERVRLTTGQYDGEGAELRQV